MTQRTLHNIILAIEVFVLILQILQLLHLRFHTRKVKQIDKKIQNDKLLDEIIDSAFWDKK